MSDRLQWGILGTGNIARQFCVGVNACRRGTLAAVGSRGLGTAMPFAQTHGIPTAHGSYDDLLADRQVQAVYLSLPNSLHREWTIKALEAGKHVLCEKPIATSAAEAQEMFDVADRHERVLVEAFMYRAHPLTHAVMETFRQGEIGALKLIRTSFCYRTRKVAGNIRFDPALAGGALMDIGCYCVNFSRMVVGAEPVSFTALGQRHEGSGVDVVAAGTMLYPDGVVASFTCGMLVQANNAAYICGDEGYIEVPVPWKPPECGAAYSIVRATPPRMDAAGLRAAESQPNMGPRKDFTVDAGMELYGVEADDFAATVLDGKAPMMTAAETVGNMRVLEEMRRQVGQP
jgi:predicted dehydrogenase